MKTLVFLAAFVSASAYGAGDIQGLLPGMTMGQARAILPSEPHCIPAVSIISGPDFDQLCTIGTTYAGRYAELNLWSFDHVIRRISVDGENSNWAAVREGLIAKYGPPANIARGTAANLSGAVIPTETLTWRIGDVAIEAGMHANMTHYGVAATSAALDADRKRTRKPRSDM